MASHGNMLWGRHWSCAAHAYNEWQLSVWAAHWPGRNILPSTPNPTSTIAHMMRALSDCNALQPKMTSSPYHLGLVVPSSILCPSCASWSCANAAVVVLHVSQSLTTRSRKEMDGKEQKQEKKKSPTSPAGTCHTQALPSADQRSVAAPPRNWDPGRAVQPQHHDHESITKTVVPVSPASACSRALRFDALRTPYVAPLPAFLSFGSN